MLGIQHLPLTMHILLLYTTLDSSPDTHTHTPISYAVEREGWRACSLDLKQPPRRGGNSCRALSSILPFWRWPCPEHLPPTQAGLSRGGALRDTLHRDTWQSGALSQCLRPCATQAPPFPCGDLHVERQSRICDTLVLCPQLCHLFSISPEAGQFPRGDSARRIVFHHV